MIPISKVTTVIEYEVIIRITSLPIYHSPGPWFLCDHRDRSDRSDQGDQGDQGNHPF